MLIAESQWLWVLIYANAGIPQGKSFLLKYSRNPKGAHDPKWVPMAAQVKLLQLQSWWFHRLPQEGGPLLSPCPKLIGQRSCHSRIPQGYEVRVFLLRTDDQGCSTAKLFQLQRDSIYQHSFQFTPTGSGHKGTFSLPPMFYPLEKRGLPCQTGPSLTINFLLGFPWSLQVGLCLGHFSLWVLSIIKPNSGQNSRLFPRILSPNRHQWV